MDICLNGHTITFETTGLETNPQINRSFLTLCDCTGKGGIDLKGHNIYIASKCSLDVSDIYITGGSGDTSAVTGGYYGIFTMGDGTVIRDNTCTSEKAGGVTVEGRDSINRNNGVFIMNGGEIRRNTGGVGGVLNYGEFTINGGTIKENYGTTTGGVANSCDYKGMPEHDIPDNYGTMTIGGGAQVALAGAGIRLYGGVRGDADAAVNALLSGNLSYDPNVHCDHHGQGHGDLERLHTFGHGHGVVAHDEIIGGIVNARARHQREDAADEEHCGRAPPHH